MPEVKGPLPADEWRYYGHDPGGRRYSPLRDITADNVSKLQRVWTHRMGEVERLPNVSPDSEPPGFQATPLVVDNVLYFATPSSRLVALDAESGAKLWEFDPQRGRATRGYHQHRGISYWEGRIGHRVAHRIFYGTLRGELVCLDHDGHTVCDGFGHGGVVDLKAGAADAFPDALYAVTSAPAIYEDLVIVGARLPEGPGQGPSGVIRAFDARSGALVWRFDTIPRAGQPGAETWAGESSRDRTGVNAWSTMSVDVERGLVFAPLGSPAYDFYGGDRKGHNLYGNSLVALAAKTGRRVWHYQFVHHDIWDYDLPAQPILVEIADSTLPRRQLVPAVVQVTKMGFVFVLDRRTGSPLHPIEERPVRASDTRGEEASRTQPIPVRPPPLVRTKIARGDLADIAKCAELFAAIKGGQLFTPIGTDLTLVVPGTLGGATWSGGSVDPTTRRLFVNLNELPLVAALTRGGGQDMPRIRHYEWFRADERTPCLKPPYGTLKAIDLQTGEIVWSTSLGGPNGAPNLGGSIVTAAGLLFIGGTTDKRIRAFDARDGRELWSSELEAAGHATPITYRGRNTRKQFVVIAAGGGGYLSPKARSDALAAFALP